MSSLFFALAFLLAAGILAFLLRRRLHAMQAVYIALTGMGCILGLFSLVPFLRHQESLSLPWLNLFTLSLGADSLSIFFILPVFLILPLAVLYSRNYLHGPEKGSAIGIHYLLINILAISMVLLTMARDFLSFAVAWELMSLSSFFLVLYDHERKECRKAGYIYLLFTQAGAFFIFAAFGLLYYATGSLDFADMSDTVPEFLRTVAFFLALTGFASKAGVFPLHIWLPHAHPAAPAHVSAILSGVMIKMGIYGILRLYFILNGSGFLFGHVILFLGILSGLFGVVHALGQTDLKKLLAYSSIENIGIILIGMGLGMLGLESGNSVMAGLAFGGALLHVLNHALFKPLLFMGAGAVLRQSGLRSMDRMGGLGKTMPVTGKSFLAGSVAISGLPPLNGFVGEFLIYLAAFGGLSQGSPVMLSSVAAIVGLAFIGGLGLACFTRAFGIAFLGDARTKEAALVGECGMAMRIPMAVLAVFCLLVGLVPEPFIRFSLFGVQDVLPQLSGVFPQELASSLGTASRLLCVWILGAVLVRYLLYRKKTVSRGTTWGCGFTRGSSRVQYTGSSFARSILNFHSPILQIRTKYSGIDANDVFPGMTRYETEVRDRAESVFVKFLASPVRWVALRLHWIQQGRIQLYIAYIVFTMLLLLLLV